MFSVQTRIYNDDFPFLSLDNGSLRAHRPSGISITNATTPGRDALLAEFRVRYL